MVNTGKAKLGLVIGSPNPEKIMINLSDKLPTILVIAVLVGIFLALRRRLRSPRLNLWTAAWCLVFVHFLVQLFEPRSGDVSPFIFIADQGALQLSALCFIASLTSFFEDKRLTLDFLLLTGIPILANITALAFDCDQPFLYIAFIATIFYGPCLFVLRHRSANRHFLYWMPVLLITGTMGIVRAWSHHYAFGFFSVLTVAFAMPGFLYLRRYTRWTPGVVVTAGGFLLWGAVFPVIQLLYEFGTRLHIDPAKINLELWNTPKFFVAFGMILTLLEEKSQFLESASLREHQMNQQLQRFAGITSRLLTGVDLNSVCHEIAQAISETSTFRRVTILLSGDGKMLYPAGYAGMSADNIELIRHNCAEHWKLEKVIEICKSGRRLGENARLVRARHLTPYKPIPTDLVYETNEQWSAGDKLFLPLQSARGAFVGCIAMDEPRDVAKITAEELSKIELLAGDLAVTIDNGALHRQLVRSEKLAAIGQLVAGVAHELNNPLTSIVGYSELMTDEIKDGPARQKLDKMLREAKRMRRIIENLLRFARQNNLEKKFTDLKPLVLEVLALREYHIRQNDVAVQIEMEPELPHVSMDEDQIKQILLNLLNNSMDALDGIRGKRIHIEASHRGDRVVLHFDDNGPGFTEPNRVFDPFYTTKPVGKGTGLGLSICYGIVKEHGGEIQAMNLQPRGARVALELPLRAPAQREAVSVGSADSAVL